MEYLKRKLITYLTKALLPIVEPEDIIAFSKGNVFINKEQITEDELGRLRAEAIMFMDSRLYNLINSYFSDLVRRKMFIEGTDITDLVFGKSILYALSVQNTICNNIKNAKNVEKKV